MALLQSLFTGITGLKGHQERLDVIGNNIANVNTIGFKQSKQTFSTILAETKFVGTSATDLLAGRSSQQIGHGAQTSQVLTDFTNGGNEFTGREEDVAIQGEGFFIAKGNEHEYYTRDGNFSLSSDQNLVLGASGYKIQGWNAVLSQEGVPNINTGAVLEDITIPLGTARRAKPTKEVDLSGNLSSTGDLTKRNFTIYDSLGAPHQIWISMKLDSQDANGSNWSYTIEDNNNDPTNNTPPTPLATGTVSFDVNGQCALKDPIAVTVNLPEQGQLPNLTFNINFAKMTQFSSGLGSEIVVAQDGLPEGVLERFSIGADGVIMGIFSNGLTESLAQIGLASFGNNNGLISQGGNLFARGPGSGPAETGAPLTGKRGSLLSKNLEASNVELTSEFTNLIATQRAYQANARTISTSDSILQELVSLVR